MDEVREDGSVRELGRPRNGLEAALTDDSLPDFEHGSWPEPSSYHAPDKQFVSRFFSDRTKAEKTIVKQILGEITIREAIQRAAVEGIEADILQCENWLLGIRSLTEGKYLAPEESLEFGTRRTTLEMKLLDLHELKRMTGTDAWNDLSTLRRYLLFAFRDYWTAARRSQLLNFDPGGQDADATSGD